MRVAFDLDGVLADLHKALEREANSVFPPERRGATSAARNGKDNGNNRHEDAVDASPDEEIDEAEKEPGAASLPLTIAQQHALWKHVRQIPNFWETLDELEPGVIRRLATLAEERRWEVLFVTNRPETTGDTAQRQSQRWLERHGFPLPSVYVVRGSRGKIADALHLDVLVDDRPENCADIVQDSSARAILIGASADVVDRAQRLGIGHAATTAACLDVLAQADRPTSTTGLMERLRTLFARSS